MFPDLRIKLRLGRRFAQHDSVSYKMSFTKPVGFLLLLSSLALLASIQAEADSLDKLADDFWTWRAKYAPFTGDDVNRMERPGGTRDWSRASLDQRRKDLARFEARWKKIDSHRPTGRFRNRSITS